MSPLKMTLEVELRRADINPNACDLCDFNEFPGCPAGVCCTGGRVNTYLKIKAIEKVKEKKG